MAPMVRAGPFLAISTDPDHHCRTCCSANAGPTRTVTVGGMATKIPVSAFEQNRLAPKFLDSLSGPAREAALRAANPSLAAELDRVAATPRRIKALSVDAAIMVVAALTDPTTLAGIAACEKRMRVFSALEDNPHMPRARLTELAAATRGKVSPFDLVTHLQRSDDPIATIEAVVKSDDDHARAAVDWSGVVDWICDTGTVDAATAVRCVMGATEDPDTAVNLLTRCLEGSLRAVTAAEILEAFSSHATSALLGSVLAQWGPRPLTFELASVLSDAPNAAVVQLTKERVSAHFAGPGAGPGVDDAAVKVLRSPLDRQRFGLLLAYDAVDAADVAEMLAAVEAKSHTYLAWAAVNPAVVDAICAQLDYKATGGLSGEDPTRLLRRHPDMTTPGRIGALSYAAGSEIAAWLAGRMGGVPRAGEPELLVAHLMERPCFSSLDQALSDLPDDVDGLSEDGAAAVLAFATAALNCTEGIVAKALVSSFGILSGAVTDEIARVCGADEGRWSIAFGLADTWTGRLDELVDTIETLAA